MYSSSSSSSQQSTPNNSISTTNTNTNLMRYESAPSSLISTAVDSVVGLSHHHHHHHHQTAGFESTHSKTTLSFLGSNYDDGMHQHNNNPSTSNLTRHSSSPAGFLTHLTSDIGFCVSKGIDSYNHQGGSISGHKLSRLGSQLSFTKQDHHTLSQISEVNECMLQQGVSSQNEHHNKRTVAPTQPRSTSGFSLSPWDDSSNSFVFSASSSKRPKNIDDDILNDLAAIDSQAGLEMATMERLLNIPQDSVPCKIRAKRGCATHPRSIAERERRTRISGKLKRLQDLVPNMDKQTSYSDMLDLAVQHIKGLQSQIQKLNNELDSCTCGCKQNMQR